MLFSEREPHGTQLGFKFAVQPRMTLNHRAPPCLFVQSAASIESP